MRGGRDLRATVNGENRLKCRSRRPPLRRFAVTTATAAAATGTFSEACTLGAKPPSLFTHVYECKVFARIVCGSASCAVRVRGAFNGTWRARRAKGREEAAAPAYARERVLAHLASCHLELGNNGMRAAVLFPRATTRPYKRMWKRRRVSFPPAGLATSVNTLKGEQRASGRASRREGGRALPSSARLRSTFQKY